MAVMGIFSTDLSKPVNVRVYAEGAEAEKALQIIRKYAERCTGVIHDAKTGDARHTRDPKVWKNGDRWYMMLGSTIEDKQGRLLSFTSNDGESWEFKNSVTKEKFGWMWECPDYFEVDGKQIIIFSPMGFLKDGKADDAQAVCMQVKFDEKTCQMQLTDEYQFMDYGMDLYAPQSTLDEKGRRILTAWLRMPEPVDGK